MRGNFAFDGRVAKRYNRQRAHPAEVSREIGEAIAAEVRASPKANGRLLEIGVGTGRIGWPIVNAGCEVVGIDLSANMLTEIPAGAPFAPAVLPTAVADMHALPVANNSIDGVLVVHVLHLAKNLPAVLDEIKRVLRPNGVFIRGSDWLDPNSVMARFRDELRAHVLTQAPNMRPPAAGAPVAEHLSMLAAGAVEQKTAVSFTTQLSPAERLAAVENKQDSESWFLPPPMHKTAVAHLRQWAASTWDNLEEPQPVHRRFDLQLIRGRW